MFFATYTCACVFLFKFKHAFTHFFVLSICRWYVWVDFFVHTVFSPHSVFLPPPPLDLSILFQHSYIVVIVVCVSHFLPVCISLKSRDEKPGPLICETNSLIGHLAIGYNAHIQTHTMINRWQPTHSEGERATQDITVCLCMSSMFACACVSGKGNA